jgi:hypothetical protein
VFIKGWLKFFLFFGRSTQLLSIAANNKEFPVGLRNEVSDVLAMIVYVPPDSPGTTTKRSYVASIIED